MRIMLCYTHHRRVIAHYYRRAFAQLGHDVRTVGPWYNGYSLGTHGREPTHWFPWRHPTIYDYSEFRLSPKDYDLFVLFDHGENLIVRDIPQHTWAHVGIEGTNLGWSETPHKFAALMQHVTEPNVHWLPTGFDPQEHRPGPPLTQRLYDIVQLATPRDARTAMWSYIQKCAPHLHSLFGEFWGPVFETVHQQARVTWACSSQDFITMRVFEAAAMGCLLVADRTESLRKIGFVDGMHFVGYDPVPTIWDEGVPDPKLLIRVALLAREDRAAQETALRAQALVLDKHSWAHRAQEMLDVISSRSCS